MYGGKTTKLLSTLERYVYQKKKVALFKPSIDNRYSVESVRTHSGIEWEAYRVPDGYGILSTVPDGTEIVAVDEQFMIPGSAEALLELYAMGKTILVSTLQLSYEPSPFREVAMLLPFATSIEVCPAVCAHCDADAYFTRRTSGGTATIEVGGAEAYEPLCFRHYGELHAKILLGRET
jgi:thymidine kinase